MVIAGECLSKQKDICNMQCSGETLEVSMEDPNIKAIDLAIHETTIQLKELILIRNKMIEKMIKEY